MGSKFPKEVTLWIDVDGQVATEMEFGDDEPVVYVPKSEANAMVAEAKTEATIDTFEACGCTDAAQRLREIRDAPQAAQKAEGGDE